MRIAVLVFATLGAIACGLGAIYMVGGAIAEGKSVERLESADTRWAADAEALQRRANETWAASIALGISCLFGVAGVVAARRYQRLPAAVLCVLGAAPPAFVWLPGLCMSAPIGIAAALALGIGPKEPDPVLTRVSPPR